MTKYWSEI